MATSSFLSATELKDLREKFEPSDSKAISSYLGQKLEEYLGCIPNWIESRPIALGSWGRTELCPLSDVDLLFLGEEKVVKGVMCTLQERGLKVRARLPEDRDDWTVGVEAFDVLALLRAKTFDPETEKKLREQQDRIFNRTLRLRSKLRQAVAKERLDRQKRHDSIANYLEPNLKYGPGGLRDVQQALDLRRIYGQKFSADDGVERALTANKAHLLSVRQQLQLIGGFDIIEGPLQKELAKIFSFSQARDFMRDLQLRLADSNFYASWIFKRATVSLKSIQKIESLNLDSGEAVLRELNLNPSILVQKRARDMASEIELPKTWWREFSIKKSLSFLESLFDSKILDLSLKDLARVRGLVQLDHYHRYTVDAHIRQAVREVKRVFDRPRVLGRLHRFTIGLKDLDWSILLWTALFHDLAKGSQGDHSKLGRHLVEREFANMNLPPNLTQEVAWMVENHLLISTAAFRMNIHEAKTWKYLGERGAVGEKLIRLALFTAVDIRATNPEAWTTWKERLLHDLLEVLLSPQTSSYLKLQRAFKASAGRWIDDLDPFLVSHIPASALLKDLRMIEADTSRTVKVLRNPKGELWVRFHEPRDRRGQFLAYVTRLYALGASVQQSSVGHIKGVGVYDWFQIRTRKTPAQIQRQLEALIETEKLTPPKDLKFQSIDLVSSTDDEAIISFRGEDKRGLLLLAAQTLFDFGYSIRWAKVHTWGSQVDDVFCVQRKSSLELDLQKIREKLSGDFAVSYGV